MSDPVTNSEIEDVLSSIRRLVMESSASVPAPARTGVAARSVPAEPSRPAILRPALTAAGVPAEPVADLAGDDGRLILTPALRVADDPVPPSADDPPLRLDGAPNALDDLAALASDSWPALDLSRVSVSTLSPPDPDVAPTPEATPDVPPADGPDRLAATAAGLEAAVQSTPGDFEPDGSEAPAAATIPVFRHRHHLSVVAGGDADHLITGDDAVPEPKESAATLPDLSILPAGDVAASDAPDGLPPSTAPHRDSLAPDTLHPDALDPDALHPDAPAPDAPLFDTRALGAEEPFRFTAPSTDAAQVGPGDVILAALAASAVPAPGVLSDPGDPAAPEPMFHRRARPAPSSAQDSDDNFEAQLDAYLGTDPTHDEATLRRIVAEVVREELQGALGERITRNVRKLVRREIYRVLNSQDYD